MKSLPLWFAVILGTTGFAAGEEAAVKRQCEFQDSTCQTAPQEWPRSFFRVGGVVLGNVNVGSIWNLGYARRRDALGVAANLNAAIGMEFSIGRPNSARIAFTFAPASVEWSTGWPSGERGSRTSIHGETLLSFQYRGISLDFGMSEYKLGGSFLEAMGNWNNTRIGLGIIFFRFPEWGGKNFLPELRPRRSQG